MKEEWEAQSRFYEGSPPMEMWEIWEFPKCPEPSASTRVRIWAMHGGNKVASAEFELPNDHMWRKRNLREQTNGFNPQEWLNDELSRAACSGDVDYAKDLIAQGADPNAHESGARSLLAIVCQDNPHREFTNVWGRILDPDRMFKGAAASYERHRAMVRVLVEGGADVNAPAELGWTPLILAAREGDVESLKYLLSKGADPNIKDVLGESAIELTEQTRNTKCSEIIKIIKSAQAAQ